jgi:hypothetical protein
MKHSAILLIVTLCSALQLFATVEVKSSVATQLMHKSAPASKHTIDESFIRAEATLTGKTDANLTGLAQVRFEVPLGDKSVKLSVRQAFFQLPIAAITLQTGRWYEIYTPGAYFGRWFNETNAAGNGSICVNYTILDGMKITVPIIKQFNTNLHLALTTQDLYFNSTRAAIMVAAKPSDVLTMNVGVNLQATDTSGAKKHRLMANATYTIIKDFDLFAEYAATDLNAISGSSHILAGLDLPTFTILDQFRVEVEYAADRPDSLAQVGWMVLLTKKITGLKINLGVGADPSSLGSRDAGDIGIVGRITASF